MIVHRSVRLILAGTLALIALALLMYSQEGEPRIHADGGQHDAGQYTVTLSCGNTSVVAQAGILSKDGQIEEPEGNLIGGWFFPPKEPSCQAGETKSRTFTANKSWNDLVVFYHCPKEPNVEEPEQKKNLALQANQLKLGQWYGLICPSGAGNTHGPTPVPAPGEGSPDPRIRVVVGSVGGIIELAEVGGKPLEAPDSSGADAGLLAGIIGGAVAAGSVALVGAAWYARRRWLG